MREFEESPLVVGSGDLWQQATRAKFLSAIGDGTLPEEAFRRWLAQDYLFAKGLTSFQAIVTAKAPREPQRLLIAGLSALDEEMDWFESSAADRGVDLGVGAHPICRRYVDFLIASAYSQPFEVSLAILYGVEVSYVVAWSGQRSTEDDTTRHGARYLCGLYSSRVTVLPGQHPHGPCGSTEAPEHLCSRFPPGCRAWR